MYSSKSGLFRDFTVFCTFLIVFNSLIDAGFGQTGLPPNVEASGGKGVFSSNVVGRSSSGVLPASLGSVKTSATGVGKPLPNVSAISVPVTTGAPGLPPAIPALINTAAGNATNALVSSLTSSRASVKSSAVVTPVTYKSHTTPKAIGTPLRPLLLSGPDDSTDPYITNEAAALGFNPLQIFNFVRDQIGYQVYTGSMRGARGTLWNKAGNALDRSSLLVALLRASGYTAQYAQGTLSQALAQTLILSMFQGRYRVLGCPPPSMTTADPANDPALLSIAETHYWVQYSSSGGTFTDADTAFPTSQPGQTFTTATSTLSGIPADFQYQVSIELDAETYSSASAALAGNGISTTPVLTQSFYTSQIVGKPVTVGQFVSSNTVSSVFSATTNTYSPYLQIGEDPTYPSGDDVIRGNDFQEVITSFPLGSQILTGLFVNITLFDPTGNQTTYSKTLFDLIGYAARQGGASQTNITAGTSPALSPQDFTTFNILPSSQDDSIIRTWGMTGDSLLTQLNALVPQLPADPTVTLTPAQMAIQQQAQNISEQLMINSQRALTGTFAESSDNVTSHFGTLWQVNAYLTSPRILAASSKVTGPTNGISTVSTTFDLVKDDINVVSTPGQTATAPVAYRLDRGVTEIELEGQLLQQFTAAQTPPSNVISNVATGALDIINAAISQNAGTTILGPGDAGTVNSLNLSPDAIARISTALAAGKFVLTPNQAVMVNGKLRIAWLEIQADGTLIDTQEDGTHQAISEYAGLQANQAAQIAAERETINFFIGFFTGWIAGQLVFMLGFSISGLKVSPSFPQAASIILTSAYDFLLTEVFLPASDPVIIAGFKAGLMAASLFWLTIGVFDPPLPPALVGDSPAPAATPGSSPGVSVTLIPDTVYTLPVAGAQVPTVFRAQVTNTGGSADTFNLGLTHAPAGFTLESSLGTVQIPAGTQAEIGVCAVPTGVLPAPGTQASFNVTATSTSNSAITSSGTENFVVPAVSGASVAATPANVSTTPGTAVPVVLQITGSGNSSTSIVLTAATDPNLVLSGLTTPASVNAGQTITQSLTITPSSSAPLNTSLNVTITATIGSSNPPQIVTVVIPVVIEAVQAQTAAAGQNAANAAGRSDIGSTLSYLSGAITGLIAGCTASTLLAFQNYSTNLVQQINADNTTFFNSLNSGSTFSDIQNATCSNYMQALTELNQTLTSLNSLFNSPAAYPFQIGITPSGIAAQPNSTSTFKIQLQNQSQVTQTYSLAVTGIPPGLGGLNTPSITLAAQQSVPAGNSSDPAVVISQTGSTLQSFNFTVSATPSTISSGIQFASATVTLRPDVLDVESVLSTPGFVNAGVSVDIATRIANTVNQPTAVLASLKILSSTNAVIATAGPQALDLSVSDLLSTIDFGQVTIPAGTANGNYTLSVTITDALGNPLQGGTGTGYLLVGSPVTSTLTVSPQTAPTGASTVLNTLTVQPAASNPNSLQLLGSVATASSAQTVAINGTTAYVCDQNELSVVDISTPSAPVVSTTALSTFISNAANIHCSIQQGDLVIFSDTSSTTIGNNPGYLAFDISTPQSPVLLASSAFDKRFVGDPIEFLNNVAYLYTNVVFSQFGSNTNTGGDVVAVGLSNILSPQVLSTLSQNGDPVYGGPFRYFGTAIYNSSTLYASSTTLTGVNTTGGAAALDVIDISDPTNITQSGQVTVSSGGIQYFSQPLVQGNLLVVPATTGATPDPVSIVVFDVSNPSNPSVLSVASTTGFSSNVYGGGGAAVIGPNQFLFGGYSDSSNKPLLLLVDTTSPASPVVTPISIPVSPNSLTVSGNYLYMPTATGLSVYSIPSTQLSSLITGYTAIVEASNSGLVTYDSTSFNIAPTKITPGASFDSIEWDNPGVSTLTWNSKVTGLQPAQIATVAQGGTVSFTSTLGNGTVNLAPTEVNGDQLISLSPGSQSLTASPSSSFFGQYPGALYTVTLRNPTSSAVTYSLTFSGVPVAWLFENYGQSFPSSVAVPALGTVTLNLGIVPPLTAASGTYTFQIIALGGSLYGTVQGTLIYDNTYSFTPTDPSPGAPSTNQTSNVAIQVLSQTVTAGPGTTAIVPVQLTNVGPISGTFTAYANNGFAGPFYFSGSMTAQPPTIGPGQSWTGTIALQVPTTATPGSFPYTVSAYGGNGGQGQATGTLVVVANGVKVSFNSSFYGPSTAQMTVTNTGSVNDTFALTASGQGGQFVSFSPSSVTLAAGANQIVNATVASLPGIIGTIPVVLTATSQTAPSISASATTTITPQYTPGVTAAFQPASQNAPMSGALVFPLHVQNTGTNEDGYTASITGVTGGVQATLTGLDGVSTTQSIPDFQVPAQDVAFLSLNATPGGAMAGSVTVTVTSLSNPSSTATATATIGTGGSSALPPVVSAITGLTVPVHRLALLNAGASTDPNAPPLPLTFAWTLTSAPAGSTINTASIAFPAASRAAFRPDVIGTYVFNVTVSNGQASAQQTVTYTAANLPPIAIPGNNSSVATGAFVFLNGAKSYDPDGEPITFAWTFASAPQGSTLTSSSINNSQTPRPFFIPDVAGEYQLQLVVTDASASGNPAFVIVTAATGTVPPNADAGSDLNTAVGSQVTLNGSASSDPNASPLPLNYQWTFGAVPAGSVLTSATIVSPNAVNAKFTPDVAGDYQLNLVVSNAHGTSQIASSSVMAFSADVPPNASAGPDQYALPNTAVNLTAAGSSDPDNGPLPLAYLWWLGSTPSSSTAALTRPLTATPQFTPDRSGYYIARVEATDGLESGFAHIVVTAANVCDADANGVINQTDIALITAAVGQSAGVNDPRDFNHDGQITAADVTGCSALIAPAPVLQVTPSSVTFNLTQGGAATTQPVAISSTGNALSFTVGSSQTWLTSSVTSGSTASINALNVQVNPTGLGAGTYSGILTFTPSSGAAQTVSVTLNIAAIVVPPPPAVLQVSPLSLTFNLTQGGALSSEPLQISSSGSALSFTVTSSQPWLTASLSTGSTASVSLVNASVSPAGLTAGAYSGMLTFTPSSGAAQTVGVTLNISGAVTPPPIVAVPTLLASPAVLAFNMVSGGSAPPSQPVGISASDNSFQAFGIAVDQPWLHAQTSSGSTKGGITPDTLAVSIQSPPSSGSLTGHIILSSTTASSVTITVTLTLAAPTVSASVSSLQFNAGTCAGMPSQRVTLTSTGGSMAFSTTTSVPWLTVSPSSANIVAGSGILLTISADAEALASGSYSGNIVVSPASAPAITLPVTLSVGSGNALYGSKPSLILSAAAGSGTGTAPLTLSACSSIAFTVQSDQPWLTTNASSAAVAPDQIVVTGSAIGLAPGSYQGNLTFNASGIGPLVVPVTLNVTAAVPAILSVVNAASYVPEPAAGGALFTIFGTDLASSSATSSAAALPLELGGVSLTINSVPAPLLYVSTTQINFQTPYGLADGSTQLVLTTAGVALPPFTMQIADVSPGLFIIGTNQAGTGQAAAENQDFSVNSAQNPAASASVLQIFLTGQGAVAPPVATGAPAPFSALSYITAVTSATIGGQNAPVIFAGLAPGFAGLAQVNVTVPALAPGRYPLILTIGGMMTNAGMVSVGP